MEWKSVSVKEGVHRELLRLKELTRWPIGVLTEKAVLLLAQQIAGSNDLGGGNRQRINTTPRSAAKSITKPA